MELRFETRAVRSLKRLAKTERARVIAAMERLARGELPNADLKKLQGVAPVTWRLRLGDIRVLYRRADHVVVVVDVSDRKDIYR